MNLVTNMFEEGTYDEEVAVPNRTAEVGFIANGTVPDNITHSQKITSHSPFGSGTRYLQLGLTVQDSVIRHPWTFGRKHEDSEKRRMLGAIERRSEFQSRNSA